MQQAITTHKVELQSTKQSFNASQNTPKLDPNTIQTETDSDETSEKEPTNQKAAQNTIAQSENNSSPKQRLITDYLIPTQPKRDTRPNVETGNIDKTMKQTTLVEYNQSPATDTERKQQGLATEMQTTPHTPTTDKVDKTI